MTIVQLGKIARKKASRTDTTITKSNDAILLDYGLGYARIMRRQRERDGLSWSERLAGWILVAGALSCVFMVVALSMWMIFGILGLI